MIDTNALRGVIAANGLSQQDVAREIGISSKTFYSKMKRGVFGSNEMEAMIDLLSIENPQAIFFAKKST
mgnify:CR=1 FL=1